MFRRSGICALAALLSLPTAVSAASDPLHDFLPTYTGSLNADLDITSAAVSFDGTQFNLTATVDGTVGTSAGSLFVWGINRGAGIARLNAISTPALDPTVLWDSLAVMLPNGTLRVVTFPAAGAPTITAIAGGVTVGGSGISAAVPLSLLPTRGYDPGAYTFQLWSRLRVDPAADGFNSEIADFGPRIAGVPEPAGWMMMICGSGLTGCVLRRRRSAALEAG